MRNTEVRIEPYGKKPERWGYRVIHSTNERLRRTVYDARGGIFDGHIVLAEMHDETMRGEERIIGIKDLNEVDSADDILKILARTVAESTASDLTLEIIDNSEPVAQPA